MRWLRNGDPLDSGKYIVGDDERRFWSYVEKTETCWLWTGHLTDDGYGRLGINGQLVLAHRFAYELLVGPIPEGLHLDHLCRVRHCVKPDDLEPVTPAENVRRAALVRYA